MKTIGMLGGMSWESTSIYYKLLNKRVAQKLGGLHSAKILLQGVDFAVMEALMTAGDWETIGQQLSRAALNLEKAGAEMIILGSNTMHKVAPEIEQSIHVPFLHIADAVSDSMQSAGIATVALLGTAYTIKQDFYKERLWDHGFEILLPDEWQMQEIDRIIFKELCMGKVTDESKTFFQAVIDNLAQQGAQGVVLGCTEICMAVCQQDAPIPLFDTTEIHANKAADMALA